MKNLVGHFSHIKNNVRNHCRNFEVEKSLSLKILSYQLSNSNIRRPYTNPDFSNHFIVSKLMVLLTADTLLMLHERFA